MSQKQVTKKQYFVPQFYLKKFTNKGTVSVLDMKQAKLLKSRSPKSICWESFYNSQKTGIRDEFGDRMEKAFQELESFIGGKYNSICNNILGSQQITDEDIYCQY